MFRQMKFIIFLFLIFTSEICSLHARKTELSSSHYLNHQKKKHFLLLRAPDNPLVEKIKEKFNKIGASLEQSKLFNFLLGAALKTFSSLEGGELLNIGKCVVMSIEVFYQAHKFPEKNTKELQAMAKANEAELASQLKQADDKESSQAHETLIEKFKDTEKEALKVDCETKDQLLKEPDGLDYIDDVDTENEETAHFLQTNSDHQFNPKKFFRKIKEKFKALKDKFSKLLEKLKAQLLKIEETLKAWLNKPIVKALIAFFECALVPILTMALKGVVSAVSVATGLSVINVVKQGPKFLKMIIDGIKSIRTGFLKKTIKEKYLEYGKGTASILLATILSALGS